MTLRLYHFRYSPDGVHFVRARYRLPASAVRTRWLDYELLDCELRQVGDVAKLSASHLQGGAGVDVLRSRVRTMG